MSRSRTIAGIILVMTAAACGAVAGGALVMIRDLPQIRALETYSPSAITRIYAADDSLLAEIYREKRDPVPLSQITLDLKNALITAEDRQFYDHTGIDIKGIARALIHDILAGGFVQGASTISQQLAKTLFLSPEKTISRKLKEVLLSIQLERRYTKDEILELYLNQIYLGSGAYGVASAARIFFGKSISELDLAECALIAAMPKAPSAYSPLVNPELAVKRRNIVLSQMVATGIISRDRFQEAVQKPYSSVKNPSVSPAPYFVDHVKKILEAEIGPSRLYTGGLRIQTTLSPQLQSAAETALDHGIKALIKRREKDPALTQTPQGALIAMDVRTGAVLAMCGGNDYNTSRFNRATSALRQPGSAFKPIVYAHAITQGFHQASLILDAPVIYPGAKAGDSWQPENFSRTYEGEITLRKSLTHSKNIPAVRLIEKLGIPGVMNFARALGISSRLNPNLSLALGTSEVTLTELTSAYATFANQGIYAPPVCIADVLDADHVSIWRPAREKRIVLSRENAAVMCDLLAGVITEGTAKAARSLPGPTAGKTGTTNNCKDALFVGFSPAIAAGVWVGCDDFSTLGPQETGSQAALPIWTEFMDTALSGQASAFFDLPEGMVKIKIDPDTGKKAPEGGAGVAALFVTENTPENE